MMSHSNNHFQHIILRHIDSNQRPHYLSHNHQMLQEKMKRRLEEVPEDERTLELKDRIFVKVMGEDGHGRMHTWSSSMTKRRLHQQSYQALSEETIRRIRDELQTEFDDKIFYLEAQLHQMCADQMVSRCFAHSSVGTPHSVSSSSGQV
uniref:Uncharacterized protein LOC105050958 n=1 Tax=Elaeis guineensis var. tenera TaxID=51953 RepID=A0A8N4IFH6_ELAGV|nr:uncharacterized protein LOC105050958 [Elaeis guineensis]